MSGPAGGHGARGPGQEGTEAVTVETRASVLLILPQDVLDRARMLAGRATTALKLPVSLQIVLRALIEEGLKREHHPALLASVEARARAVRDKRSRGRGAGAAPEPRDPGPAAPRGSSGREPQRRTR
jgi:hypothetical protein